MEHVTYVEAVDLFTDYLTDQYGVVNVCGYELDSGRVYRKMDPVGFRCNLLDNLDNMGVCIDGTYDDETDSWTCSECDDDD